jgi:hypothetical protein
MMSSPEELLADRDTALGKHKAQRPHHRAVTRVVVATQNGCNATQETIASGWGDQRGGIGDGGELFVG